MGGGGLNTISLQACRGGKFDYGVVTESTDGGGGDDDEELMEKQVRRGGEGEGVAECWSPQFDRVIEKALDAEETDGGGYSREALPNEADFLLAYATVPG